MIIDSKPWIADLGSANGTLVDGNAVRRERLRTGTEIVIGCGRFKVRPSAIDDDPLPKGLFADWDPFASRGSESKTDRLRRLAGAHSCAWAEGGTPLLQWVDDGCWEDLGPVRRILIEELIG